VKDPTTALSPEIITGLEINLFKVQARNKSVETVTSSGVVLEFHNALRSV